MSGHPSVDSGKEVSPPASPTHSVTSSAGVVSSSGVSLPAPGSYPHPGQVNGGSTAAGHLPVSGAGQLGGQLQQQNSLVDHLQQNEVSW